MKNSGLQDHFGAKMCSTELLWAQYKCCPGSFPRIEVNGSSSGTFRRSPKDMLTQFYLSHNMSIVMYSVVVC